VEGGDMTELLITSKIPGKLIIWKFPGPTTSQTSENGYYKSTYIGQTFQAKDSKIWKYELKYTDFGTSFTAEIQIWELENPDDPHSLPSKLLETIDTINVPDTGGVITREVSMTEKMSPGKYYAIISKGDSKYNGPRRYSSDVIEGCIVYSSDGSSWSRITSYDLYFQLWFGQKEMTIEDYGYSEAYVLRVEYLENGTQIVLDDEINLRGDQGDVDDLPSQVLIPFRKAKWISGSVKFYGVGIP